MRFFSPSDFFKFYRVIYNSKNLKKEIFLGCVLHYIYHGAIIKIRVAFKIKLIQVYSTTTKNGVCLCVLVLSEIYNLLYNTADCKNFQEEEKGASASQQQKKLHSLITVVSKAKMISIHVLNWRRVKNLKNQSN